MGEIERIKLSDKSIKTNPKTTDRLFLLDMEDLKAGIPKVKQVEVGNLPFSGGTGGAPYITNTIRVEPTASADEAGKLYRTYANALAYIKTQIPSETNLWAIILPSGEFTEDVELNPFISVFGNGTVLTGTMSTAILYDIMRADEEGQVLKNNKVYVRDCIITKLDLSSVGKLITSSFNITTEYHIDREVVVAIDEYDAGTEYYNGEMVLVFDGLGVLIGGYECISAVSMGEFPPDYPAKWTLRPEITQSFNGYYKSLISGNIGNYPPDNLDKWELIPEDEVGLPAFFALRDFYELSSFVKPAGFPCIMVNMDCQINSGDFTGLNIIHNLRCTILDGEFPAQLVPFGDYLTVYNYGCNIFGGRFNCGEMKGNTIHHAELNSGIYELHLNDIKYTDIFFNGDSNLALNNIEDANLVIDHIDGIKINLRNNTTLQVRLSYEDDPAFNGNLYVRSNNGRIQINHTTPERLSVVYFGDEYDNRTSGLVSTEMQRAIDELKSLIGGGSESFFELIDKTIYNSTFIKIKNLAENLNGGISLDPRYEGGSFSPNLYNSLNIFGSSNIGGARSVFGTGSGYNVAGIKLVQMADLSPYSVGLITGHTFSVRGNHLSKINNYDAVGYEINGITGSLSIVSGTILYDPATDCTTFVCPDVITLTPTKRIKVYIIETANDMPNFVNGDHNIVTKHTNEVEGTSNLVHGYRNKISGMYNSIINSNNAEVSGMLNFVSDARGKVFGIDVAVYSAGSPFEVDCDEFYSLSINKAYRLVGFAYDPMTKQIKHIDELVRVRTVPSVSQFVIDLAGEDDISYAGSQLRNFYDPFYGYVQYMSFLVDIEQEGALDYIMEKGLQKVHGILNIVEAIRADVNGLLNECYADDSIVKGSGNYITSKAVSSQTYGNDAHNWIPMSIVNGAGKVSEIGDRQSIEVNMKGQSRYTDEYGVLLEISSEVFGKSIQSPLVLPRQETAWKFVVEVMGIWYTGSGSDTSYYFTQTITGMISNGIVRNVSYGTPIKDCPVGWGVTIAMTDRSEFKINCTNFGDGMYTVDWIANVRILQLINNIPT